MNFLKNDEFLILMVHEEERVDPSDEMERRRYILTTEERKQLYDVGMRTVSEQPQWAIIEPSKGEYDFDYLDRVFQRDRDAGLKVLASIVGWRLPAWIPDGWKARMEDGRYERESLSMWNEEAQAHLDKTYEAIYNHYIDDDDIMFIFAEFQGGEGVYQANWCLYDECALKDYRKIYGNSAAPNPNHADTLMWYGNKAIEHFVRRSKILYPKYKEVWNMQQLLMDDWTHAFGNFAHKDILRAYKQEFPDGNIVLLQYTYFDDAHKQRHKDYVDEIVNEIGCEVIVEAMYCKGLPTTTPQAIAKGFRGQIVRPAIELSTTHLENWEVDSIKNSIEQWKRSRGI